MLSFLAIYLVNRSLKSPQVFYSDSVSKYQKLFISFSIIGTKYCGNGNSQSPSNSTNTKHSAVDACCKDHDHCPHFIPKWTQKYNLFNWRPYTISACACDRKLKACLHSVNTQASRDVKRVYFEVLGVPCFEFELKTVRVCKKRTWFMACKKFQMTTEYHANLVAY